MNIESTQTVKVNIVLLLFGRSHHGGLMWLAVSQKTDHYHRSTNDHLPQAEKIDFVYRQVLPCDNHDLVIHARRKRKDQRKEHRRASFFF